MTMTENADSDNQVQVETWLAGLRLNPQLGEDTLKILEAWKKRFWKRRPKDTRSSDYRELLAASLYAAIKADPMCSGIALHDFLIVTKAQKKSVLRHYRKMVLDMGITPQACSIKPGPYLDMLLKKVNIGANTKADAVEILSNLVKQRTGNPILMAAGAAYAAMVKDELFEKCPRMWEFAKIAGVSEAALRRYFYRAIGNQSLSQYYRQHYQKAFSAKDFDRLMALSPEYALRRQYALRKQAYKI